MIYTKQEWYTPAEIAVHNNVKDCWISLNGKVLDMTNWLEHQFMYCKCLKTCTCGIKNWYCTEECTELCPCFKRGFLYCDGKRLAKTIVAFAGKDVSHWFKGDDWIKYTHPVTGSHTPFMPHGPGPFQPVVPSTRWRPFSPKPWWLDERLVIGKATAKTRPIRLTNTITGNTVTLEVCSEETLNQITMRYIPHNAHVMSYTWRYLGKAVVMSKTLEENGIIDDRELYDELGIPNNFHIPAILLYYNDDLTEDPPRDDCYCYQQACIKGQPEECYKEEFKNPPSKTINENSVSTPDP